MSRGWMAGLGSAASLAWPCIPWEPLGSLFDTTQPGRALVGIWVPVSAPRCCAGVRQDLKCKFYKSWSISFL